MATLIPARVETHFGLVPRSLVMEPPLTDAEFETLCAANDIVSFERTREGKILMHPPSGGFTSQGNAGIISQLHTWWKAHRRGRVFDSNGGFFLNDGSVLSPDASYVTPKRLTGQTKESLAGFPRLCPDFVIDLLSKSDSLPMAKEKMQRWIEHGVALAWLIDPYQKTVFVYQPGREADLASGEAIHGSGPVEGFALDLQQLWRCYEV